MLDILFGGGKEFDDYPLFQPDNCTAIEDCLKMEIVLEKIKGMDYFREGFGTFLRKWKVKMLQFAIHVSQTTLQRGLHHHRTM